MLLYNIVHDMSNCVAILIYNNIVAGILYL